MKKEQDNDNIEMGYCLECGSSEDDCSCNEIIESKDDGDLEVDEEYPI